MKTLVYLNLDCFADVDMTVLKHFTRDFHVYWFYIHESIKTSHKITIEQAKDYATKYGINLRIIDPKNRYRNPKNVFFFHNVVNQINDIHPDVVYYCLRDPYWVLAVKLWLRCKNVVLGVHNAKPHSYVRSLKNYMIASLNNFSIYTHRHFITFSENQQKLFKEIYGKESCMVKLSCKDYGSSNVQLESISNGLKLLFFGRINRYKGLDTLIETLEALRAEGIHNINLTIAGEGEHWPYCMPLIKTKEMYNLQIRFLDSAEIPDLMSSHHFLVLPYRDATQSGPLVAAVAYNLPIIAPNFGCFMETYNNDAGILYTPGDLKDVLMRVSLISQKSYERMRDACKRIKEDISEETVAKRYIEFFNSLS